MLAEIEHAEEVAELDFLNDEPEVEYHSPAPRSV